MSRLSRWQRRFLEGGQHANFHISASEWGNPELHELIKTGLFKHWSTMGGFPAGRTTDAGRAALQDAEQ